MPRRSQVTSVWCRRQRCSRRGGSPRWCANPESFTTHPGNAPYAQFDRRVPGCGRPASATSIGSNPFYPNFSNQCTYYAEERMRQFTGLFMPVYGNAYQWASQAANAGWHVSTAPALNSVVVFPAGAFGSSVGHVAWVVDYTATTLRTQDYNWNWVGATVTDHWVPISAGTQYIYGDR